MVKTFKIKLSEAGKKVKLGENEIERRVQEQQILIDLLRFQRQNTQSMNKCIEINESITSVESISIKDPNLEIEFTREEIKYLQEGFSHTTKVPERDFWLNDFIELFKQINNCSKE